MKMEINLIGIGKTGKNIVEKFSQIKSYNILMILEEKDRTETDCKNNCVFVENQNTHEDYEKSFKEDTYDKIFDVINKEKETFFILNGVNKVTGITFRLMELLQDVDNVSVIYITSELESFISNNYFKTNHELVLNVSKQLARSGILNNLYIFDNEQVSEMLKSQNVKINIKNYYDKINEYIFYIVHLTNYLKYSEKIFGNINIENNFFDKKNEQHLNRITIWGISSKNNLKDFKMPDDLIVLSNNFDVIMEVNIFYYLSKKTLEDFDVKKIIQEQISKLEEILKERFDKEIEKQYFETLQIIQEPEEKEEVDNYYNEIKFRSNISYNIYEAGNENYDQILFLLKTKII